ncbi:hypothetical protein HID58_040699 [Brassica napus]|uniref:ATPase AAA-type core domain-containing protein n=1 Tax=Brassica napus TaxID=3708 RepID=A0ABQ8B8T2_BRANA|nr:hypothetical protein HID58_040699 [Brassica napus]
MTRYFIVAIRRKEGGISHTSDLFNCHEQFKHCVNRLCRTIKQSNGTKSWLFHQMSSPTVYNGMDYDIFFSRIFNHIHNKMSLSLTLEAVANSTSATFLRVVGSELIQKVLGDGPKLVRELFRVADDLSPSIVIIDEIDAVGTKRR